MFNLARLEFYQYQVVKYLCLVRGNLGINNCCTLTYPSQSSTTSNGLVMNKLAYTVYLLVKVPQVSPLE